jgi:prevent-host-death family protein
MTTTTITDARSRFADYIHRAQYGHERVVLTAHGQPAAAIISIEDLELLRALEDAVDLAAARLAVAEAEREGTIAWNQLKSETID